MDEMKFIARKLGIKYIYVVMHSHCVAWEEHGHFFYGTLDGRVYNLTREEEAFHYEKGSFVAFGLKRRFSAPVGLRYFSKEVGKMIK